MKLKALIGSGDKIILFTLPVIIIGLGLNILFPNIFSVSSLPTILKVISIFGLIIGAIIWFWSVALILIKVSKDELITSGPFALVKHPIYSVISLLVLPCLGILLNTWVGLIIGGTMYYGSRKYRYIEEDQLERRFGALWIEYKNRVMIPWL